MSISTMKSDFDSAGQFGIKPRIHPNFQQSVKEIKKEDIPTMSAEDIKPVFSHTATGNTTDTITESFICPNCNAEFSDRRRLHGHMLKYTRNKK